MQHLSTAFLIIALVIVVNERQGVTAEDDGLLKADQIAEETKRNALTLVDGPKYVAKPEPTQPPFANTASTSRKPEQRPPSKPPIFPDKQKPQKQQKFYVDIQRPYYGTMKLPPNRQQFSQPLFSQKLFQSPNAVYNFPKVIPLPHHKNQYYIKQQPRPVIYAAGNGNNKTVTVKGNPPKFSVPVQTIKGVRVDSVKPPKINVSILTSTAAPLTTTRKYLRTKRIWPKKILEQMNATSSNRNKTSNNTSPVNITDKSDYYDQSASITRIRYVLRNDTGATNSPTRRPYRPVTRVPRKRTTTPALNLTGFEDSDWVPIINPTHYPKYKRPPHSRVRRSAYTPEEVSPVSKRMLYLQSYGLIRMPQNIEQPQQQQETAPEISRKKTVYFKKKNQFNPYYSGYSAKPGVQQYTYGDLHAEGSHSHSHRHHPRVYTKIKHHHHHHHHRYVKTVEKPIKVPYKVEVPKPYPVHVEKKIHVPVEKIKVVEKPVPYPVTVEKKVPYPIGIKVPHPVPYKVIEKEYVPKPYPVVHHVPVTVEKKVPYPVEVRVPVDRPVQVTVEKQVPYPVPVRVLVPQPYPVEKRVPYPVQVKVREPVEVIKHVPVKVPYPQPFAVKVPVQVEKKVPYPVEVEKRVPVPIEIYVPQKVEVEKKVPVYIPKPYPVEKQVPVPVKVPYPVEVPVYIHDSASPGPGYNEDYYGHYGNYGSGSSVSETPASGTSTPEHTVTVHGNTGFTGFYSRSDNSDAAAAAASSENNSVTTATTPSS